jgi:hypothetical protein
MNAWRNRNHNWRRNETIASPAGLLCLIELRSQTKPALTRPPPTQGAAES